MYIIQPNLITLFSHLSVPHWYFLKATRYSTGSMPYRNPFAISPPTRCTSTQLLIHASTNSTNLRLKVSQAVSYSSLIGHCQNIQSPLYQIMHTSDIPNKGSFISLPTMGQIVVEPPQRLLRILGQEKQESKIPAQRLTCSISPTSWFSFTWNIGVLAALNVYLLMLGFQLGFGLAFFKENHSEQLHLFFSFLIVIFTADILVCFNRGFHDPKTNDVCRDRDRIVQHYLYSWDLVFDVVSLIPLILYVAVPNIQTSVIQALFVLKFAKRSQYQNQTSRKLTAFPAWTFAFWVMLLLTNALIVTHYVAVLYILMDRTLKARNAYSDSSMYWMSDNNTYDTDISPQPWYIQYLYAQFFSTGTLSLIAPGPSPKNPVQALFTIGVMVFYIIYASNIVNSIINMASVAYEKRKHYESEFYNLYRFLKVKEVDTKLSRKVENHFEYLWGSKYQDNRKRAELVGGLPFQLQKDLIDSIFVFSEASWISSHSAQMIKGIIRITQKTLVQAGEYVITKDITEKVLFHCKEGSVQYSCLYGSQEQLVTQLSENRFPIVGQTEFITDQPYVYDVMVKNPQTIEKLNRQEFISLLKQNNMYLSFCRVRDQVMFGGTVTMLCQKCLFCQGNHTTTQCQQIHFGLYARRMYLKDRSKRQTRKLYHIKNLQKKPCKKPLMRLKLRRIDSLKVQYKQSIDIDIQANLPEFFPQSNLLELSF